MTARPQPWAADKRLLLAVDTSPLALLPPKDAWGSGEMVQQAPEVAHGRKSKPSPALRQGWGRRPTPEPDAPMSAQNILIGMAFLLTRHESRAMH
jgi:hypothetical protein